MTAPVMSQDELDREEAAKPKRARRRLSRKRLRTVLLLAGILPALVALALLLKVAVMLSHDSNGRAAFADEEYQEAAAEFGANLTLNWFEPWVAPFNRGTAEHAAGDHDAAIDLYRRALADVPAADACLVRLNLALAHEDRGDAAEQGPPPDMAAAVEDWKTGLKVLTDGDCATDPAAEDGARNARGASYRTAAEGEESDAQKVADRLRSKIDTDTDKDGISDGDELSGDRNDDYDNKPTDPKVPDTDGDGLPDGDELERGTDPNNADTDGGGAPDGAEVGKDGTDPLDPSDDRKQSGKGGEQGDPGKTPKEKELDKRNQEGEQKRKQKEEGGKTEQGPGRPGGRDPGDGGEPQPTW